MRISLKGRRYNFTCDAEAYRRMRKALAGITCAFIALEGLYSIWIAYSIYTTMRLVPTGEVAESFGRLAVYNLARGVVLLTTAAAYSREWMDIRRWLYVFSIPAVAYGIWSFHSWYALMISWKGLFTGDLVVLETASCIGFIVIGVLLIVARVLNGKCMVRASQPWRL